MALGHGWWGVFRVGGACVGMACVEPHDGGIQRIKMHGTRWQVRQMGVRTKGHAEHEASC